jgi:hypothetical protein
MNRTPSNNGMHPTANQRITYRKNLPLSALWTRRVMRGRYARRGEDTKVLKLSGSWKRIKRSSD